MKYKNSFFQIVHKEDGTYMKLFPPMEGGEPLSFDIISRYLTKHNIQNYDIKKINEAISKLAEQKEIKLTSDKCLPIDESVEVTLDGGAKRAIGMFFPPSNAGKLMTKQEIVNELIHEGIKCGVNEEIIEKYMKRRQFLRKIVLAEATPAVQGKSAVITYHFKTEGLGRPKVNEDGSVDFHDLDMINHVNAGDVLATLEPADFGKPGIDILGNVIKPVKVVQKSLRHGANIHLSEDNTIMYSDVSGHVMLADDRVFVSDTYEVPADVSTASGDVEYDGNVLVHGNVVTGFTVKAKGDIIVEGVVEGATLIAEGQIILKRGIQGMGRGVLKAAGNITAHFLESCEVDCGGEIVTEAIMHSLVTAKGNILVTGKKSMITGGEVKSGTGIAAKILGSTMCTKTSLCIGADDAILKDFHATEVSIEEMKEEQAKLAQYFAILKKRMESGRNLTDEQKKQLAESKTRVVELNDLIQKQSEHYAALKAEIDTYKDGRIKFFGTAYPGVKVTISTSSLFVKEPASHGQFVLEKGDIRVKAV